MRTLTMISSLLLTIGLITAASAQFEGYAVDSNGKLVHDSFGNCVKTGTWTKEKAIPQCDPKLAKQETTPVAPSVSTPEKSVAVENTTPVTALSDQKVEQPKVSERIQTLPTYDDSVSEPEVKPLAVVPPTEVKELPAPMTKEQKEKFIAGAPKTKVYFAFNKAKLTKQGKQDLIKFVQYVNKNNYTGSVKVFACADPIGSTSYNQKLSERRAQVVKTFLEERGINVETYARGEIDFKVQKCSSKNKSSLKHCYRHNRVADVVLD